MRLDRILCLANSYKHEHRCVAGISLLTNQWVRLVGTDIPGCLSQRQTCYENGIEASVLDVFEAELGDDCGSLCHPEDVLVTSRPWRLVYRFDSCPVGLKQLVHYSNNRPFLLGTCGDRVYLHAIEHNPMKNSLELIHAEDLWWWIREDHGRRKNRAVFRAGHGHRMRYDLPVTDPKWLCKMQNLPPGIYPHAEFFDSDTPATFLTISLSEAFEGFHYKLVAGVVNLPC